MTILICEIFLEILVPCSNGTSIGKKCQVLWYQPTRVPRRNILDAKKYTVLLPVRRKKEINFYTVDSCPTTIVNI